MERLILINELAYDGEKDLGFQQEIRSNCQWWGKENLKSFLAGAGK